MINKKKQKTMNYAEHMIVEEWKDFSTEEIIKIKKASKSVAMLNTEWILFHFFMFIFSLPSFAIMIGSPFFGLVCLTINLVIYLPIWFLFLKPRHDNKELLENAKKRIKEMDTVLKYRN